MTKYISHEFYMIFL